MSRQLPLYRDEMLEIEGVTEANYKAYDGNRFTEITQKYKALIDSKECYY